MGAAHKNRDIDYGAGLVPGERLVAAYAASAIASRGREHAEPDCSTRSQFQRDRDRIIHATAFRRLTHKTQVFLYHEGDHYRSRLTHSLEVAQIARTVARQLCLDEDLAETLALAHDLGHPPFGHAGERALDAANAAYGGFDHNAQSLRVVLLLERKYTAFDGLNLTWETIEGLLKHNGPLPTQPSVPLRQVAERLATWSDFRLADWPCAEAQVAALADDVAYATHDVDDGLRAGLITLDDLHKAPIVDGLVASGATDDETEASRRHYDVSRRMITLLIGDLVATSRANLRALAPASAEDIRAADRPVIAFSTATAGELQGLKRFLFARVYRHSRVMKVMAGAEAIVADLFARYGADDAVLPEQWRVQAARLEGGARARLVADFVAGMTDRYAIAEHRRLFDATPQLR